MRETVSLRSTARASSFCCREKASIWLVSRAPRSAAWTTMSRRRRTAGSSMDLCNWRTLPSTTVSRLLKSWATPEVSWPTASSRWAWRRADSARSRSAIWLASWRLAAASSLVRSWTRASSCTSAARIRSSIARASYWRRRPRRAVPTTLTRVVGWKGRSRKVTLPSTVESRLTLGLRSSPPPRCASSTNGKSDHGGCALIQQESGVRSAPRSASSATRASAAPSSSSAASSGRSAHTLAESPASRRIAAAITASRPRGASTRARSDATAVLMIRGRPSDARPARRSWAPRAAPLGSPPEAARASGHARRSRIRGWSSRAAPPAS